MTDERAPMTGAERAAIDAIRTRLNAALRGKEEVNEHVLACLLARGHLLVEDLPGLGKTTLAKALAGALGGAFARVQCTPDLLPGDITGFRMYDQRSATFEFLPGPVFADVLLADEINRATPRTQSALLEAMAERQVTIDNVRHVLADTFFVIATQNPVEQHGTYPLPEAQLDRFAMKLRVGYPDRDHELAMLAAASGDSGEPQGAAPEPLEHGQLKALQDRVAGVAVGPAVRDYLVRLAHASRAHPQVTLGLSPRGLLIWQRLAQARAFLGGRGFVTPDDVQDVARPTLEVRLGIEPEATARVLADILGSVAVPVSRKAPEPARRAFSGAPIVLACLGLLGTWGCSGRDGGTKAHGHHGAHAGHEIPAHRPKSFPEAVRRLRAMTDELALKLEDSRGRFPAPDETVSQAVDIATWLPDIAAESDMPERPWNEVNARSAVLAADLRTIQAEWSPGRPAAKTPDALADASQTIKQLEGVLAACDPGWFGDDGAKGASR